MDISHIYGARGLAYAVSNGGTTSRYIVYHGDDEITFVDTKGERREATFENKDELELFLMQHQLGVR